jgi:Helix-hairpin-helix domain
MISVFLLAPSGRRKHDVVIGLSLLARRNRRVSLSNGGVDVTNASIAAELMALAQFLAASGDNPFRVRAYRRAATTIRTFDINSSPDRSDLSANHGRLARQAGVKVAITTMHTVDVNLQVFDMAFIRRGGLGL